MYESGNELNMEAEDSRTRLIKELTEENHSKDLLITKLRKENAPPYDNPNIDITKDIDKISKVITHLTKHMKLTRDVGAKARLGNAIGSNNKIKNVLVQQVIGLDEFLKKQNKLDRTDHRFS